MKEFTIGGAASAATKDRPTNIPHAGEKQASTGATIGTPCGKGYNTGQQFCHTLGEVAHLENYPFKKSGDWQQKGLAAGRLPSGYRVKVLTRLIARLPECSGMVGCVMPI